MRFIDYLLQDMGISLTLITTYLRTKLHLWIFCRFNKHEWTSTIIYHGHTYQKRFFKAPNLRSKCAHCNLSYYDFTIKRLKTIIK